MAAYSETTDLRASIIKSTAPALNESAEIERSAIQQKARARLHSVLPRRIL